MIRKPIANVATQRNSAVGLHVCCCAQPSIERCRSMSSNGRLAGAATTDAVTNAVATVGIDRAMEPARASTRRADHAAQAIAVSEAAVANGIDQPRGPQSSQTVSAAQYVSLIVVMRPTRR